MSGPLLIVVAGHPMQAWGHRALSWPRADMLVIAYLYLGNQDRALDARRLRLQMHGTQCVESGLVFRHEPGQSTHGHVLAGLSHPVQRLRGVGLSARLPVFWLARDCSVLPAFSDFTGTFEIRAVATDRVLA